MSDVPRIGSAAVVRRGDELLVGRRAKQPNEGLWVFPGGRIKPFESIADAARRELWEEAGLRIVVIEQLGAFEIIEPPEHRIIVYSWARLLHPGVPLVRPGDDISELGFFTLPPRRVGRCSRHRRVRWRGARQRRGVPGRGPGDQRAGPLARRRPEARGRAGPSPMTPTIASDEDMDWGYVLADDHAPDYETARRILRARAPEDWGIALGTIEDHDPRRRSYRWTAEHGEDELVPCEPDDPRRDSDWWVFDLSMNDHDLTA